MLPWKFEILFKVKRINFVFINNIQPYIYYRYCDDSGKYLKQPTISNFRSPIMGVEHKTEKHKGGLEIIKFEMLRMSLMRLSNDKKE